MGRRAGPDDREHLDLRGGRNEEHRVDEAAPALRAKGRGQAEGAGQGGPAAPVPLARDARRVRVEGALIEARVEERGDEPRRRSVAWRQRSRQAMRALAQEDFKDLVKYAADRFIEIVPELESPAHATAAVTALALMQSYALWSGSRTHVDTMFLALRMVGPV